MGKTDVQLLLSLASKRRTVVPVMGDTHPPVRNSDPAASHAGAAAINPHMGRLQRDAMIVFLDAGERGATNEDLYAAYPGLQEHSIRPRVNELKRMGFIERLGRRMGSHGVAITVWRISENGKRWAHSNLGLIDE